MDRMRILYIDDDINMLNTGEDILMDAGYDVSLAKSGEQAIKLLKKGIVCNLILLDVDMPVMDGYETFAEIRKIDGCEDLPIVFLTGMDAPDFEIRGLEMGAADYIAKPFIKDVLLARVRTQLRKYTAENSNKLILNEQKLKEWEGILSPTETAAARLVAEGLSNREIAEKLGYSYGYVKKIVSNILEKLGVINRSEIRNLLRRDKV